MASRYTPEQRHEIALAKGLSRGSSPRVRRSLLEAMAVESNFRNLNYGDRDSQGVLQQRPSQGWGPPGNPAQDIQQYLSRANRLDRQGFRGTPGQLAQAVQHSAFPGRYDQRAAEANALLGAPISPGATALLGGTGSIGGGIDRKAFASALLGALQQGQGHLTPEALTQTIGSLRSSSPAAPEAPVAQTPSAGAFAFPVAGPHTFSNDWGAPRADTGHHEGTDIFAPRGTPVVAIENGTVTKMGPSKIGGNRVWVNGRWYYAHLDTFAQGIRPGVKVRRGQVLGYVGTTGDAQGTPPHLHFGYSPDGSQGASWANPYPVLKGLSRRRGR